MTTSPTLTPRILGQAEKAHQPALDRILAGTGLRMDTWAALTLTSNAGGTVDRDLLVAQITGAVKIDEAAALAAIAGLTATGLLRNLPGEPARIGFTDPGRTRYDQLRSAADEIVARVYADVPAEDLATAARVLIAITARLNAETASA
jgi:hypothetical protein